MKRPIWKNPWSWVIPAFPLRLGVSPLAAWRRNAPWQTTSDPQATQPDGWAFRGRPCTSGLPIRMGDRLKVAGDVLDYADFFFIADDQLAYDEKAFKKRLCAPGAAELLAKFKDRLAEAEPFDAPTLEKLLHDFVEREQSKIGQIIHPLRMSVTGKPHGPGMFDCLACLARIDRALGLAAEA